MDLLFHLASGEMLAMGFLVRKHRVEDGAASLLRSPSNQCAKHTLRCTYYWSAFATKTCRTYSWRNHVDDDVGFVQRALVSKAADGVHLDELGESISTACQ
jgi:hypothetical protein